MDKTQQILRLLGKYKYLTITQMNSIGVVSYSATQRLLKKLTDEYVVGVIKYAGSSDRSSFKAENVYYLMPNTAKSLMLAGLDYQHPKKRSKRIDKDFKHRIYTINIQLSYERWASKFNRKTNEYKNYFTNSDEFEVATSVKIGEKNIAPDFIFSYNGDKDLYFIGELTNGKDTRECFIKLNQLYDCMKKGLFKVSYGWNKTPRVLSVLETNDLLRLTLERMKREETLKDIELPLFFFNTIENISNDFDLWYDKDGKIVKLSEL